MTARPRGGARALLPLGVATPFLYYGSKARVASEIVSLLPPHRVYAEPFCGSAAVLFHKSPTPHEILNDRFGEVVNFFRVMRALAPQLAYALRLTPYARDEFEDCRRDRFGPLDEPLERARRFFVLTCQSVNATAAFRRSAWSAGQRQHTSRAHAAARRADALEAFAERLRSVTIENTDALDVIDACDLPDAAIYVDPPYLRSTRTAGAYAHEFMTDGEHEALAERLLAFSGAVVLSGYNSPLYSQLYGDWDRREIATRKSSANTHGQASSRAIEVIWSNRPIEQQQALWDRATDPPRRRRPFGAGGSCPTSAVGRRTSNGHATALPSVEPLRGRAAEHNRAA
ncbi:DNA adenine methylase [Conexibacter sp. JD483]|uniref:DNA adenine methylase n=1 Tax=unclassified Conexibacter TaxID=2627773 RepID=UPI002721E7B6|nr:MULTISPECIES: DNA adenine methylase [unclassified Conexibacter]MDO8185814.1 DNA adenine methylase [Conexibacter sp. CPCC 205706]MDO8198558.1 DNA adenine methylase [Conexibacter sp. CPCC 205762]MDR9367644.1 DNA adenine methylase [Conexibacter sp. JD483]